VLFLVISIY